MASHQLAGYANQVYKYDLKLEEIENKYFFKLDYTHTKENEDGLVFISYQCNMDRFRILPHPLHHRDKDDG
jgi:hypothetical protein